jgi:hypothetical protein
MEEINLLKDKDIEQLVQAVGNSCGILLPNEKERLGEISFHLYKFDNPESSERYGKESLAFQIRFGMHPIFSKKHIKNQNNNDYVKYLSGIICENKEKIYASIIEYCQSQLDTIVAMELEPEFNRKFPYIFNYDLKLCKSRNRNKQMLDAGWPSLCIAISWNDEYDEFQEFMYPLTIDPDNKKFNLDPSIILSAFQNYRDAII